MPNGSSHSRQTAEQGNVLFLILIAVALFAALSYAVTLTTRSGGGNVGKEKAQLLVDQISQYGAVLSNAVTRVILGSNCSIMTVDFASPAWNTDHYDISALSSGESSPPDNRCDIFAAPGGGVVWQAPPHEAIPTAGGEYAITGRMGIEGVGTVEAELVMGLNVTSAVCTRVNEQLGIVAPGGDPPNYVEDSNGIFETPYDNWKAFGNFTIENSGWRFEDPPTFTLGDSDTPELNGQMSGCYYQPDNNVYVYYQVLMPR